MYVLSDRDRMVLKALRDTAQPDELTIDGKRWRKVSVLAERARQFSRLPSRTYRWGVHSLEHAGLLRDWPGNDHFAAVAVEGELTEDPVALEQMP